MIMRSSSERIIYKAMSDTTSMVKTDRPIKNKISFYLMLFGIVGIILAIFMAHCQINHTNTAQVGSGEILTFLSDSAENASIARIITYFEDSTAVTVFTFCCVVAVVIALLLPSLTIPVQDLKRPQRNSICTVFASSLLGFLFAGYVVNYIITPLRPIWTNVTFPGPDFSSMTTMLKVFYYGGIAVAIPCAIYFLSIATQSEFKPGTKMCILSVCPVIWLSLRLVFYFMSTSAHVNISGRKLYIVSMILAVLFFIQDAKRWIPVVESQEDPRDTLKHSKMFFATGFASIVTFTAYHLSTTYLQAFWILRPEDSYILNGIFISMILFIAFRLSSIRKS